MSTNPELERARSFFINPKAPDANELQEASSLIIRHLTQNNNPDILQSQASNTLLPIAKALAADYEKARRFDHLSVAQLHPSDNMLAMLARTASGLRNNNTIIYDASPRETILEQESMKWMLENVAGYDPAVASGSLVSGGTNANITAMFVARELLQEQGWDGQSPATIFASEMAHYSVNKAARLLGPAGLIHVDAVRLKHNDYTMDPRHLELQVENARKNRRAILGIVAVAGETETGLVEDLDAITEIAERSNTYLHVDGAYGAPFALSREHERFASMKEANSITCDPHKYLYTPYPGGAIMFRSAQEHARVTALNEAGSDYMFKTDEARKKAYANVANDGTHLGNLRIEGSMGGDAAATLHTSITHLGRTGYQALLNHTLDMTQEFTDRVESSKHFTPTFNPQLNTLCVQPKEGPAISNADKERVEKTSSILQHKYGVYLSTTSLPDLPSGEKQKVLRFVATHPHTDSADIQYIADSLEAAWKEA